MSHAFVQLYPDLEHACREALVLTPTERLRRNLIRAYDEARRAEGRRAWTTPRVQTLDAHLAHVHDMCAVTDPGVPVLLSPEAEFQRFRATAPAGAVPLVPLAQKAWSLCHLWSIPLTSSGLGRTENGRVFLDWSERLKRRLSAEGVITRAELAAQPHLQSPERDLCCLAFERLPTGLTAWLDRQVQAGSRVRHLPAVERTDGRIGRTALETPEAELAAAAQWAHRLLVRGGADLRIGIVIPDLASRHTAVLRQLTAEFDPLLEHGIEGLVDIGGGTPLAEQPVWQGARDWLRLCFDGVPADTARRCLNDPFLTLPGLDQLPPSLPPRVDLRALDRSLEQPALRTQLAGLTTVREQPLHRWLEAFTATLDRAGWNGRGAGSVQFQAWQEIRRRMEALGATADDRAVGAPEALSLLEQWLHSVTFAPERPPAPVQVMGYLETTGLQFSHLWVAGLDDQTWPQPPTRNPFIPVSVRRHHGVARSTPEEEADFAADRLRHWRAITGELILSHARLARESEQRPSPLIRAFPEAAHLDLQPGRTHPHFTHRHGFLESVPDPAGAPLPEGTQRGGSGRIRDQAICPIRGYAIHRLGLTESRPPHGLPDALDRGILIHEALHRLYENALTAGIDPQALTTTDFERAADRALVRCYARYPTPFRERERRRLVALLERWNELECDRGDGTIEALELGIRAEFDHIGLKLRIDRMDRIEDALVVIDYKTGRVGHRLNHDRLIDPQLPLYALTNPDIRAVLYAEVDERQPRLKGISAIPLEGAAVEAPVGGDWDRQRARWQRQVDTLTREIRTGLATVTPYGPAACQNCHLHGFCRVALDTGGTGT